MANVSGITGCGPLYRDIMLLLEKDNEPVDFPEPPGLVQMAICPLSGLSPNPQCPGRKDEIFIQGTEPKAVCPLLHSGVPATGSRSAQRAMFGGPSSMRILFPHDGDVFKLDPVLRNKFQSLKLRVRIPDKADIRSVTWWVNGRNIGQTSAPHVKTWNLAPGDYIIKATASAGGVIQESRPVKIFVLL
jgi:penicillin-binding protein 1C